MPLAAALARKLSTHCGKGCAADCANVGAPNANVAVPARAVCSKFRRAKSIFVFLQPNHGEDTAAGCGDLLWSGQQTSEDAMNHSRRAVIAGAGAGLVTTLAANEASAQAAAKPEIQASEYWAQKGDVKLYLYR